LLIQVVQKIYRMSSRVDAQTKGAFIDRQSVATWLARNQDFMTWFKQSMTPNPPEDLIKFVDSIRFGRRDFIKENFRRLEKEMLNPNLNPFARTFLCHRWSAYYHEQYNLFLISLEKFHHR